MKRLIIISILALSIYGCDIYSPDEILLQRSDISLTEKGEVEVDFDTACIQLGFNDRNNEYRAYDDKLSSWFVIRCSERPSAEGQEVSVYVKWTGKKSSKAYQDLTFTVEKMDAEKVWMWNESNRIGIIIKNII